PGSAGALVEGMIWVASRDVEVAAVAGAAVRSPGLPTLLSPTGTTAGASEARADCGGAANGPANGASGRCSTLAAETAVRPSGTWIGAGSGPIVTIGSGAAGGALAGFNAAVSIWLAWASSASLLPWSMAMVSSWWF